MTEGIFRTTDAWALSQAILSLLVQESQETSTHNFNRLQPLSLQAFISLGVLQNYIQLILVFEVVIYGTSRISLLFSPRGLQA